MAQSRRPTTRAQTRALGQRDKTSVCARDLIQIGAREQCARVHVCTWNLLSAHLCQPDYYEGYPPDHIDNEARLGLVLARLREEIDSSRPVICLQEVSSKWRDDIETLFAEKNYRFFMTNYPEARSGALGVAIAVPVALFEIRAVKYRNIAKTKQDAPAAPAQAQSENLSRLPTEFMSGIFSAALSRMYSFVGGAPTPPPIATKEDETPWQASMRRNNEAILLVLRCRQTGVVFTVATYHMPCMFYLPPAMTIHMSLLMQFAQDESVGPLIVAGDFNIKPRDLPYHMITTGETPDAHPNLPLPHFEGDQWQPGVRRPMKSAYVEILGEEPGFTTYTRTRGREPFRETLDYIFVDERVEVESVDRLPTEVDLMPNPDEPSDHLMLFACLLLHAS